MVVLIASFGMFEPFGGPVVSQRECAAGEWSYAPAVTVSPSFFPKEK